MPKEVWTAHLKNIQWGVVLVALALGIMLSLQFRFADESARNLSVQRVQQLRAEIEREKAERDRLQERLQDLRRELDQVTANPGRSRLRSELDALRIQAGVTAVAGPGVEVTLNDSEAPLQPGQDPNFYVLHDEDLLKVINELRAAGAEALAINGERILATTEIRCNGPVVIVNRTRHLAAPFVVSAIGDPDTLVSALKMKGGVLDILSFWGIKSTVKAVPRVEIPAYSGAVSLQYARPKGEGG